METLPDRVPVLPMENYPNPIPEENATHLIPSSNPYRIFQSEKRQAKFSRALAGTIHPAQKLLYSEARAEFDMECSAWDKFDLIFTFQQVYEWAMKN